jgi:hypothetical protein
VELSGCGRRKGHQRAPGDYLPQGGRYTINQVLSHRALSRGARAVEEIRVTACASRFTLLAVLLPD